MKHSNLFFLVLILIASHGFGQSDFHYRRDIGGVTGQGWYGMSLPSEIFKHLNNDLSDIRLYALDKNDTLELPYLLNIRTDEVTRETLQLPLSNKSYRDGIVFLTFELLPSRKVNYIDLEFNESNYFGFVTIEGSNDKSEWFEIVKDQRIVSIKNGNGDYALSTVTFSLTDYRFLRVAVKADIPLTFRQASFQYNTVKPGVYHDIPLVWKMSPDKKLRRSVVEVKLVDVVPLSSIRVQTDDNGDYYRAVSIESVRDSAKTEKGWVKYYEPVYDGNLTSFKPNDFDFNWRLVKELRIIISDRDNAPLAVRSVSAAGPEVRVISYLKAGDNFMLYGAEGLRSPSYDLAYFENKIPDADGVATLGSPKLIKSDKERTAPLFERTIWLWGIMALMIGVLGFFTLKMMKGKG
ncbi:MAG TPA: DUF3999 family protein [Chryseosolibacter sp.]|nr:DUF3999 family protein [Chryseosolibacter sp.]